MDMQDILKYFLFGGDFEKQRPSTSAARPFALRRPGRQRQHQARPRSPFGIWGAEDVGVRARRKIAQTIWHTPNPETQHLHRCW